MQLLSTVNQASSPDYPPSHDVQVLILEPDERIAMEILSALEEAAPGTTARVAGSLGEAQCCVIDQEPALFVLDVDGAYDMAQEFIYDLRTSHPKARAIILTAIHVPAHREQVSGLGAIHFLEKPFPRADFITLVEALLLPAGQAEGARFQGTLSDLHVADIIQLKCISGATSMLEFTGPRGEKARVYFENGQVRHAAASGKEGMAAFGEIIDWQGGLISEVPVPHGIPHTIDLDWQVLLMEAVRKMDESRGARAAEGSAKAAPKTGHRILVIDDSVMLLSFVKEILEEQGYEVVTAETGEEGLCLCGAESPDLVLLDFVLPDMKGDEVCRRLMSDPATANVPVVYVSGFGSELQASRADLPNIIGSLSKPFTSDALVSAARGYISGEFDPNERMPAPSSREMTSGFAQRPPTRPVPPPPPAESVGTGNGRRSMNVPVVETPAENFGSAKAYFCGDSSFFSLNRALHTIAAEKLTGTLRFFWSRDSVDLLARDGRIVIVTTRNPGLYCEEAPVALLNVPGERVDAARARQATDGCPTFVTLAKEDLIQREPGLRLMQHYGQRLFAQLWTDRVRFIFVQHELPGYAAELPSSEDEMDQWALSALRLVQYQELGEKAMMDAASVPAYTRDGFERVQQLHLTVAEAQFASQFNGSRSIAQITKNLLLDIKFAQLTLFCFLALEIVECWPAQLVAEPESRGGIRGIFGR
ncbi:MAG: response regulator [Chthoniobacterales bacterium]